MTKEEVLKFLVNNAERTFYGNVHKTKGGEHGVLNIFSVYLWGSEEECMRIYQTLGFGGVHKTIRPINGHTHEWHSNGPLAEVLSSELKPLLKQGGIEAQRRAQYCR